MSGHRIGWAAVGIGCLICLTGALVGAPIIIYLVGGVAVLRGVGELLRASRGGLLSPVAWEGLTLLTVSIAMFVGGVLVLLGVLGDRSEGQLVGAVFLVLAGLLGMQSVYAYRALLFERRPKREKHVDGPR